MLCPHCGEAMESDSIGGWFECDVCSLSGSRDVLAALAARSAPSEYERGRVDEQLAVRKWLGAVAFGEVRAPALSWGDAVATDTGTLCVIARLLELGHHTKETP